jgi:hypothetical protein
MAPAAAAAAGAAAGAAAALRFREFLKASLYELQFTFTVTSDMCCHLF